MSAPDELIHQSLRLKIMASLTAERGDGPMEFTTLRSLLKATDGNLGAHLATLERAGYVTIEKDFVGKKPRTRVAISPAGGKAFRDHVAYLRDVLDGSI